ncbi:MAG: alpha/beta fold hydrolase [Armatimonadetes bacterium]|nr:alpha/beta fold hydrolase [Armatimonadota bacterium]
MSFSRFRLCCVWWLLACGALAARADGDLRIARLGDFPLENVQVLQDCRIGYRTFGTLNADRSNAVLFPTWFGGTSQELAESIGPGRLVDSRRYFVIAVDALGNGVSSSPSNSPAQPGTAFPAYSIRDMVATQHKLLTQTLQIPHLKAVIGVSMGGFQVFEWLVAYPQFCDKGIAISGTPRPTAFEQMLWQSEHRLIEASRSVPGGDRLAKQAMLNLLINTPAYINRQTQPEQIVPYLARWEQWMQAWDLNDWDRQLQAMMGQDIYRTFGGSVTKAAQAIRAEVLIVASSTDGMVQCGPSFDLARVLKARPLLLKSDAGHDGWIDQGKALAVAVARFLARSPKSQSIGRTPAPTKRL